jgi:hypothetical protein
MVKLDTLNRTPFDCKYSRAFKDLAENFDIREEDIDFDRLSSTSSISFAPSTFNGNIAAFNGMMGISGDKQSEKSTVTGKTTRYTI